MLTPPLQIIALRNAFASPFTKPAFRHLQTLILGALLTTAGRTVASALRAVGLANEKHFQNYQRLLSRDQWSKCSATPPENGQSLAKRCFIGTSDRFYGRRLDNSLVLIEGATDRHQGTCGSSSGRYFLSRSRTARRGRGRLWSQGPSGGNRRVASRLLSPP